MADGLKTPLRALERPLWCLALSVVSTASALPALAELEPGTFHLLQPPQEAREWCSSALGEGK